MSDQSASTSVAIEVELQPEVQSFLTTGIDLKRLLRDVARQSKNAVEALVKLLDSKDEKIQLTAAKALLELQVNVADKINSDQLNRLIAEMKLNGAGTKRLVNAEQENRPLVDFSTIREI